MKRKQVEAWFTMCICAVLLASSGCRRDASVGKGGMRTPDLQYESAPAVIDGLERKSLGRVEELRTPGRERQRLIQANAQRKARHLAELKWHLSVLKTNSTVATAAAFSDAAEKWIALEPDEDVRRSVFQEYDKAVWILSNPRLCMYAADATSDVREGILKAYGLDAGAVEDEFLAVATLLERKWRLMSDARVRIQIPLVELQLFTYAKKQAGLWRARKDDRMAGLYEKLAERIEALAEAEDGPIKADFDNYRTFLKMMPQATPSELEGSLKRRLAELKSILGRCPGWAEKLEAGESGVDGTERL